MPLFFFVEKVFRKESIQFLDGVFSLFPVFARLMREHIAEQNNWCLNYHICVGVTAVGKPEVVGKNPAVHPFFFIKFQLLVNVVLLFITEKQGFSEFPDEQGLFIFRRNGGKLAEPDFFEDQQNLKVYKSA